MPNDKYEFDLEIVGMSTPRLSQSSIEARSRILYSKSDLILQASDMLRSLFDKVASVAYLEQPVLTGIKTDVVNQKTGHIQEGEVNWSCNVMNQAFRKKAKFDIQFKIQGGILHKPSVFKVSSGKTYSFNEKGIRKAMRLPENYGSNYRNYSQPHISRTMEI